MSSFVGENPVIMSGSILSAGEAEIVVGDGLGNTLTFRWTDADEPLGHGSPSAIVIDLPAAPRDRLLSSFALHQEGRATRLLYAVEWLGDGMRLVTYTLCEDIRTLLIEAETPALARHDSSEEARMSTGSA